MSKSLFDQNRMALRSKKAGSDGHKTRSVTQKNTSPPIAMPKRNFKIKMIYGLYSILFSVFVQ